MKLLRKAVFVEIRFTTKRHSRIVSHPTSTSTVSINNFIAKRFQRFEERAQANRNEKHKKKKRMNRGDTYF